MKFESMFWPAPSRCPGAVSETSTEIDQSFVSLCPFRPVLDNRCVASTSCPDEHALVLGGVVAEVGASTTRRKDAYGFEGFGVSG